MWTRTRRLVPSVYPTVGILDHVASPEDLPFIFELESWTNDRISTEWESCTDYHVRSG